MQISVDPSGNTALGSFNIAEFLICLGTKLLGAVEQNLNNIL